MASIMQKNAYSAELCKVAQDADFFSKMLIIQIMQRDAYGTDCEK